MDSQVDVQMKLSDAWRVAAARMVEAGYDAKAVYSTMLTVAMDASLASVKPPPGSDEKRAGVSQLETSHLTAPHAELVRLSLGGGRRGDVPPCLPPRP
jgi:hypothetical protein